MCIDILYIFTIPPHTTVILMNCYLTQKEIHIQVLSPMRAKDDVSCVMLCCVGVVGYINVNVDVAFIL